LRLSISARTAVPLATPPPMSRSYSNPSHTPSVRAGSGVGTAAVQLASHFGAAVVAVAGADGKLGVARALGAAHTINYKAEEQWGAKVQVSERWSAAAGGGGGGGERSAAGGRGGQRAAFNGLVSCRASSGMLQEVTQGRGADLILDPVGGSFWRQNAEALAVGGWCGVTGCLRPGLVRPLLSSCLRSHGTTTDLLIRCRASSALQTGAGCCTAAWAASMWTAGCLQRCVTATVAAG
jgi:hypothetical protein